MTINLTMPITHDRKPKISVVGVGGAGGNAVNNMITSHLEGVEFVACNTDAQALAACLTERRIQLGATITHGLGAGARPEVGGASAEEALDEILDHLQGSNMVFITAGMGGGTGTGAAPVIARAVREQGILTVGVVTKPFHFEGAHRMRLAESGLTELQQHVDTLIVIPNQNLFRLANEQTTFADAFRLADQVLHMGVRGVTDLMVMPGLINLDFADIRTVMSEMGKAMMGTGEAEGDKRAIESAEAAISNPLLDEVSMRGARGVLINITGGMDMTLFEVDAAANRVREEVDNDANIIFGSTFDDSMQGRMRVSVVATGIDNPVEIVEQNQQSQTLDSPSGAVHSAAFAGWFPHQTHRPVPYPAPKRGSKQDVREPSPVAQLRTASGEASSAHPSFVPPPAEPAPYRTTERSPAMANQAASASDNASRSPGLLERVKELAFARQSGQEVTAPQDDRVKPVMGSPRDTANRSENERASVEGDTVGGIPTFLRKEKEKVDS